VALKPTPRKTRTNSAPKTSFRRSTELIPFWSPINVAKPSYQTPKAICNTNRAYDCLDLTTLPDDYLPRTNYRRGCGRLLNTVLARHACRAGEKYP